MNDKDYRDKVEADFELNGFCECAFKGTDHFYEIFTPNWDWNKFDYRTPSYAHSKSVDDIIGHDHMINDLEKF